METPVFWKTALEDVEAAVANAQKASEKRILTQSPGGRPVHMIAYGPKKEKKGTANYSSACGAHDINCFHNPENLQKTLILIGAEHGHETEGVAAIMNVISLMETGFDLAGQTNEALLMYLRSVRLVMIPVANPDGRARVKPDAIVGLSFEELRYWGQGTWKDGSLCGWPDCKKIHPMKDHAGFLGGYFNDDGININADNYFHCMAQETQALLDICEEEQADMVLHLHGGGNCKGVLLQSRYITKESNEAIYELSRRCYEAGIKEGLEYGIQDIPGQASGQTPQAFDLMCAVHHVCGAVSICYESNEGITDMAEPHRTHEEINRMHMILFEQAACMLAEG